jgi:phosphodiesterase/alkaline phosphatase D-like protein
MRLRSLAVVLALAGPIGMSGIAHAQTGTSSVQLSWTAPGDDGMTGTGSQYDLRYSTATITSANFASATRWVGTPTPTAPGTTQSTTVTGLQSNTTYWFAIKAGDEVPNWSVMSNVISFTTTATSDSVRPAMVANLAITSLTENSAVLTWTAVGDDSLTGTATSNDVRYSTSPITAANWLSATQASGEPVPASPGTTQTFTVNGLTRQTTYYMAMKVADDGGNLSALSNVPSGTTPDLTRPATITDLTVGFVWIGSSVAGMVGTVPGRSRF